MASVVWLGDEDPSVQTVTEHGVTFVKGEAVTVPDKHAALDKFKSNPMFHVGAGKAEPVESQEPAAPDVEAGTEKAALKEELRGRGISVQGNPSVETLRAKLADAVKKADA